MWRFVPESRVRTPSSADRWGALTLSGGLVCLLVALTEGPHLGWGSPAVAGLFAGALALLGLWCALELRVDDPMVDMRMLARRGASPPTASGPRHVAGLWMLPTSLSLLAAGPLAGLYGSRHGSRGPLVAGMVLVAIGSAGIAAFHAEPWQPAAWFILCGIGSARPSP